MPEIVFSFGTLQLPEVQRALFGRAVETTPDALAGYVVGELRITDPEVIAMSGADVHPALRAGGERDVVTGVALEITSEELAAADRYERVSYRRASVTLLSGRAAWVYLPKV
ncbi:Gamma-glutamyl cyclotransferase, AIG2-like [Rathayibacter oskolensis]|uniref:Gamma-glutamyl cyclotransferase, AIG2-like n=1 Tax=Rathayibacter oskolensis TaxID=1891671 RepID=A0A1X7NWW3_9MICO|nr:gamma-glutamylcyclotransferase family protein [Rathayibacter oskolensis]SMH42851.1 Gamma-glutamyl cyclotransferase, AIG2-like [Rathayibacter oskolensis]